VSEAPGPGSAGGGGWPGERAQPFYCPYCAEEELRPTGGQGEYYCPACDRRFALRFLGLGAAPGAPRGRTRRLRGGGG
jgi:predicted RNA-binding Zn-ribbon protein involved in translation (DUF1610 family)